MVLYGGEAEERVIADVLARARGGRSGALVVRGEAGIGKTVLLENAARNLGGTLSRFFASRE